MQTLRSIRPYLRLMVLALACAAIGLSGYLLLRGSPNETTGMTDNAELVDLGAQVYAAQCAACHGANLEGQPNWRERKPDGKLPAPPHDETGHTWHHDDKTLFALTKFGLFKLVGQHVPTDMPAYDGVLSDREIHAVLAYIKSRWPAHVRQRQAEISNRAATPAGS